MTTTRTIQQVQFVPGNPRGVTVTQGIPVEAPPAVVVIGALQVLEFRPLDSRMQPFSFSDSGIQNLGWRFSISPTLILNSEIVYVQSAGIELTEDGKGVLIPLTGTNTAEMFAAIQGRESRIMWAELAGFEGGVSIGGDAVFVYRWKVRVESRLPDDAFTEPVQGTMGYIRQKLAEIPECDCNTINKMAAQIQALTNILKGL